jgi:DNA mismatch repair protein MutS2
MLEQARRGALILLDEVAGGTDPAQGGALARALIERFADVGARVVATTHHAQLKAMAVTDARVGIAAMEYREGRPTYRILPGLAGESHAFGAALAAGIEPTIVERARSLMDRGDRALQETLARLEDERGSARDALLRAEAELAAVAGREARVAAREAAVERGARKLEQEAAAALVERARRAEREIGAIVAELQRAPSSPAASAARAAVGRVRDAGIAALATSSEPGPEQLRPGDPVRIEHLGLTGRVVAVRTSEVEVQTATATVRVAPRLALRIHPDASGPARTVDVPPGERPAKLARVAGQLVRSGSNTLDLRGTRVEEALQRLERFLDEAMLGGYEGVFILHGHGTDALKRAVREALRHSPYVETFEPAATGQGGDALTAVVLRG